MSKIALEGNASGTGTFTVAAPNSNSNYTLTLPQSTGTVVVTGGAQTIEFAAGTASTPSITFTGDTNTGIFSPAADTIAFTEGGAESMRIDSSGNLGLGVTPSAWGSGNYKGFQIGGSTNLMGRSGGSDAYFMSNTYFDQTNYKYVASLAAARYTQSSGEHQWYNAASGTAGNTITFTQAMTLDASGQLAVGTTTPNANTTLTLNRAGFNQFFMQVSGTNRLSLYADTAVSAVDAQANPLAFYAGSAERARITSGGDLLVGTTTNTYNSKIVSNDGITDFGTQFNTARAGAPYEFVNRAASYGFSFYVNAATVVASLSSSGVWTDASDARYKENIADSSYGLDAVIALKPRTYNLIDQTDKPQVGFIAQEVLDVVPEVVDTTLNSITEEERYTLSYGQLTAVLTKAIQELKAINDAQATRIETLETKVAVLENK